MGLLSTHDHRSHRHKDLTFWFQHPHFNSVRGIPEIRSCRILMFMQSGGALIADRLGDGEKRRHRVWTTLGLGTDHSYLSSGKKR